MNAERDYLLDELGDGDAPIGSKSWALWLSNEIRKTYYDKRQTGERLRSLIETFKTQQAWQVFGFLTWEAYCEKRLQLAAQDLDAEARDRVKRFAENATPLNGHGGDRQSENFQGYNYNLESFLIVCRRHVRSTALRSLQTASPCPVLRRLGLVLQVAGVSRSMLPTSRSQTPAKPAVS